MPNRLARKSANATASCPTKPLCGRRPWASRSSAVQMPAAVVSSMALRAWPATSVPEMRAQEAGAVGVLRQPPAAQAAGRGAHHDHVLIGARDGAFQNVPEQFAPLAQAQ